MLKKWLQNIIPKPEAAAATDWRTENSILNFLKSRLDENGNLPEQVPDLPDETIIENKIRFVPGLFDAMFGSDVSDKTKVAINDLTKHIKRVALNGDRNSDLKFYQLITADDNIIGVIDDFLQSIIDESLKIEPHLISYSLDLISKSKKRNAVKFGIAIMGLCQNKCALNEIKILGQHDEFTIYSTVAISHLSENIEIDLWELAKKVNGWGKIQLVDRLAQQELNESIKDWLIRDGYKNNIMHEYLAHTCAIKGELHKKLAADEIDNKLFKSASDIIVALIATGGPAEDITTYPFAAQVTRDFVKHAKMHSSDISDFNVLHKIKDYLADFDTDIGDQSHNGWTSNLIECLLVDIVGVLDGKNWRDCALDGLRSNDNVLYWEAKQAALKLGIELWDTVWQRLNANPLDSSSWYDVTHYSKPEHADQIIDFALMHLPFEELGTGPSDSNGFGKEHNKFASLEFAITFLETHPRKGEKIVLTGLRCPVIRNRNMAIKVLEKWRFENWSPEIRAEVNRLKAIETNDHVKESIERLLR